MTTAGPDDEATEFVFEMGPTAEPVIRCTEVSRVYGRPADPGRGRSPGGERPVVRALDGVSLAVRPGEVVGISGPSGSGKSTLLHLISALDTPTDGTVEIAGTALGSLSERGRTRLRLAHVGIVFQRFYLLGALSAQANVALPLVERGVGKASRRARATELLEAVGLGDRLLHRPGELSGGEQQRVAIARALVNDPDVLLADEPTGELDTATGERVIELLAGAADERAVVLASHDTRVLEAADRVVELRDGRRRDDG